MSRRNAVKVVVRTRPTSHFADGSIRIEPEHATISVELDGAQAPDGVVRQNVQAFRFDHVFHNASQSAVYDLYCRDVVQQVIDGVNGAVMTYGREYAFFRRRRFVNRQCTDAPPPPKHTHAHRDGKW
jgi:hypothetical protein